jgi:hypothetical protein
MSLTSVVSVQIRPDRAGDYEAGLRGLAGRAAAKQDTARWTAHQVAVGAVGTMHFVSRHGSWAEMARDFPADTVVRRILGDREAERFFEETGACIVSRRHVIAVDRPDLSYPRAAAGPMPMAVVTVARARPGGQEILEDLIRRIAEAIPKLDDPGRIVTFQSVVGDLRDYWTVRSLAGLGDLDGQRLPPELLCQAFGAAEGGRIYQAGLEAIESVQRELVLHRPELSHSA